MASADVFMTFHALRVRVRVVEPEQALKHRIFILSSPLTSAFNWRKLTPELSALGCLTAIADMPGFGESDAGGGAQGVSQLAKICWGVIDEIDSALDGEGMWHLAAHGISCRAILEMTRQQPESVISQILISPLFESGRLLDFMRAPGWFEKNLLDPRGFAGFMSALFARAADDYILDIMRRPFARAGALSSFSAMLAQRSRLPLGNVFCPSMVITGERDILSDARAAELISRALPEAETHALKTAGHMPMETHSHALRDYFRGWIKYVG